MLCAPIYRNERMIAVIGTGYATRRGPFSSKQRRLLVGIGHAVAVALDNERLIGDLRAASQLKSEFVSTMSHELRTPLSVILGYTDMLARRRPRPPTNAARTLDAHPPRRARAARADRGHARPRTPRSRPRSGAASSAVAVAGAARRARGRVRGARRRAATVLRWERARRGHARHRSRASSRTILKNLVGNALKFTPQGAVDGAGRRRAATRCAFAVRDTGIGIATERPAGHLRDVPSERQLDTRSYGGVGLGLYIVQRLLDRLGGDDRRSRARPAAARRSRSASRCCSTPRTTPGARWGEERGRLVERPRHSSAVRMAAPT